MRKSSITLTRKQGRHAAKVEAKVAWLVAHESLWRDKDPDSHTLRKVIVDQMKKQGLVSTSTYWLDVHLSVYIMLALERIK